MPDSEIIKTDYIVGIGAGRCDRGATWRGREEGAAPGKSSVDYRSRSYYGTYLGRFCTATAAACCLPKKA
jgi:hypothetical protein